MQWSQHAKKHERILPPPEDDAGWIDYAEVQTQVDDEKKKEDEKAAALAAALADGQSKRKLIGKQFWGFGAWFETSRF